MAANTNTSEEDATLDPTVSLIRGGLFYRAQLRTRLIFPHQWNMAKRVTFAIAIGWCRHDRSRRLCDRPSQTVVVAAPAVGTIVSALPGGCAGINTGGAVMYQCSNVYYRPYYQGSTLVYQVVTYP